MRSFRSEQEIMANWKGDLKKPVVSICCITHNHEPYIEDALEGFFTQETDFPFEILIHDDASTDKTADIIREYEAAYPNVIKPMYQSENQYSKGKKPNPEFNFPRAKGEYIALCEGDDYWIDANKLQIQVDFLKNNPEYGLVHTDNSHYFQNTGIIDHSHKVKYYPNPPNGFVFNILIIKNFISTLTVVAKKKVLTEAYEKLSTWIDKNLIIDYTLWLEVSRITKIMYIDKVTAMYRISAGTVSRPVNEYDKSLFLKKRYDIVNQFMLHYDIDVKIKEKFYFDFFGEYLNKLHKAKNIYYFEKKEVEKYKPQSLKGHLLKFLYLRGSNRYLYFIIQLPARAIRKGSYILKKLNFLSNYLLII